MKEKKTNKTKLELTHEEQTEALDMCAEAVDDVAHHPEMVNSVIEQIVKSERGTRTMIRTLLCCDKLDWNGGVKDKTPWVVCCARIAEQFVVWRSISSGKRNEP